MPYPTDDRAADGDASNSVKAVVLAAGKGTRLYPVTRYIPKPILPLCGRPMLAYAFDELYAAGIRQIALVVPQEYSKIEGALGDGSEFGVELSYWVQSEPKGLAHATKSAQEFCGEDKFLLYLGDAVYDEPLATYREAFDSAVASCVCLVKEVEDPRRFGVAELEGERITRLEEKPQQPRSNWAMAGVYFFDGSIWEAIDSIQPSARGEYEITDAIQWLIDQGQTVLAARYEGNWFDTGTLASYLETTRYLLDKSGKAEFTDLECDLVESSFVHQNSRVRASALINSVVLPDSEVNVRGRIQGSLLAGNVQWDGDLIEKVVFGDEML